MLNRFGKQKQLILVIVALVAITSIVVPISTLSASSDNDDGNSVNQGISQSQSNDQESDVSSDGDTDNSGNNDSDQEQDNSGDNAASSGGNDDDEEQESSRDNGRDSDDDDDEGTSVRQGIAQIQSNNQESDVSSGGDTTDSGNNDSVQEQDNSGDNAAAINGDDDDYSGSVNQGIAQIQRSNQESTISSEGDTTDSGNNFSVQDQLNTGSNAAVINGGEGYEGSVNQGIAQIQSNNQESTISSEGDVTDSGNNFSVQDQLNTGSNAAVFGGGYVGTVNQGIAQLQQNSQISTISAGGDVTDSGNSYNRQSQSNSGSNVFSGQ